MLRFQTPSSCACLEWWLWNSADDTFFNYRWSPPWKMFLTTVLRTPQWWWQMWYTSTRVSVGSSGTTKASSDRLSFQNMNKYSRTRFSSPTGGFSTWIQRWTPPPPPKKFSFHANVWVLVHYGLRQSELKLKINILSLFMCQGVKYILWGVHVVQIFHLRP